MARLQRSAKGKDRGVLPIEVEDAIQEIGGLERLAAQIPPAAELNMQVAIHKALSDRTRLEILWALHSCDLCPCVLKEYLGISDSRLSYHLSVLEDAGLASSYSQKNWRIFSISEAGRAALRGARPAGGRKGKGTEIR